MKEGFLVTYDKNFIRIIRLPQQYPEAFCFSGGHDFKVCIVDWFNPHDQLALANNGHFVLEGQALQDHREKIRTFIKEKPWYLSAYDYVAITIYGDAFLIEPERIRH